MPLQERTCPTCRHAVTLTDAYCPSCGGVLSRTASADQAFTPLALSSPTQRSAPGDLHPLHIVPDTSRQRRRLVRRVLALLGTVVIAAVFGLALWLVADRGADAPVVALAVVSGMLTMIAVIGWASFALRRARKRARRHEWRMSTS